MFQGPGRGPYNVFPRSYVFIKFAKGRYFNLKWLSIIKACQLINRNIIVLNFLMFLVLSASLNL